MAPALFAGLTLLLLSVAGAGPSESCNNLAVTATGAGAALLWHSSFGVLTEASETRHKGIMAFNKAVIIYVDSPLAFVEDLAALAVPLTTSAKLSPHPDVMGTVGAGALGAAAAAVPPTPPSALLL